MNAAPSRSATVSEPPQARESIVVVGNGPVGFRFVQYLVSYQLNRDANITIFGEEPQPAYDRVNLTSLLDDGSAENLTFEPRSWYESRQIRLHTRDSVVLIDREEKTVRSRSGRIEHWDRLVLATGSRPYVPPIPGVDLEGVFVYRTIEDLKGIQAWAGRCRDAVVLGGGLLGLEAAAALQKLGCDVQIVEMASVLMPRQLDNAGAHLLQQQIECSGMRVHLQRQTKRIDRRGDKLEVVFAGGDAIHAGLIVVSAGIRPRDELARGCGLSVGRRGGIIVNDRLQTQDPAIFAIGECAMHNGTVYGLVAPGIQMAHALANRLRGMDAAFRGCRESTRLKLVGVSVALAGDYMDTPGARILVSNSSEYYLKLILSRSRLAGLIAVGDVPQIELLKEAVDQNRRVYWWQIRRFERTGKLWRSEQSSDVSTWPASAVVCSCCSVTRGCLDGAAQAGCSTVEALAAETGATTACGACRPLVEQLAGNDRASGVSGTPHRLVAVLSMLALSLVALLVLASPVVPPLSVQTSLTSWQTLLADSFWKQFTGYFALGLAALSLVLSLKKRTSLLNRFSWNSLRAIHIGLAISALVALIVHTGFHRGNHLNFALFSGFMIASITGAAAGLIAGVEHRLSPPLRAIRRPLTLAHILSLWPLPLLVAFHIVAVYWF